MCVGGGAARLGRVVVVYMLRQGKGSRAICQVNCGDEMLRKKGKETHRKTKQHNTTRPRQLFFKENSCLGWDMHVQVLP